MAEHRPEGRMVRGSSLVVRGLLPAVNRPEGRPLAPVRAVAEAGHSVVFHPRDGSVGGSVVDHGDPVRRHQGKQGFQGFGDAGFGVEGRDEDSG